MEHKFNLQFNLPVPDSETGQLVESVRPSDEAERDYLLARYNVSDKELAARTTAAPCLGGSLLVELNEFLGMKVSIQKIHAWREAADICLRDAQYEGLSITGRADAAFDACYLYARCIVGEKSELYTHPDTSIFVLAAAELGWFHYVLRPARQHVYERDKPLRDGSQFDVLMALAVRLKRAIDADAISGERNS